MSDFKGYKGKKKSKKKNLPIKILSFGKEK